ncbi:trichohyalin-like isoform X2 [Lytechinus variegatus]|uniref:trichohyalin-like isoform X2 n=1 Tax=Lytechinus variegatus TaxID=7654 RepID=UPI001BB27872|nr:trichohyalin-like isoform X2 [Lytechinus variegatus]
MGSGSSKTKNGAPPPKGGAKNVVVAEVVVPNKSEPIKITGELDEAPPASGSGGQATVKEIGHNKFSLQVGDKNIGTFEASDTGEGGDFSSYLANTASLTIKNIETVAEDGDKMASSNNDTMVIQLDDSSNKNFNDEVEWEEVIQTVEETPKKKKSSRRIDLDGTDRKAQLEEALQSKQAKLSEQEYEQMIANHRQEVELMTLLREKEKERQKFSLASKVAARKKKRRKNKQTDVDGGGDATNLDLQSTARYQELQEQIAQQKAQMELALEQQKGMAMGQESEQILEAHNKKMAELEAELKREQEKRSEVLNSKLAERKRRRKARKAEKEAEMRLLAEAKAEQDAKDAEEAASAEKIQADIEAKQAAFQREVESKKAQLSADEYQRLLAKHEEEIAELSRKANIQRLRQGQNLQDKLDARRRRRDGVNTEKAMTAAELQRMEAELKQRQVQFEAEMKEKKSTLSQEEYKRLIAAHKQELADMQTKLDGLRERQQDALLDKLAARRAKRANKKEEQELIAKLEAETVAMTNPDNVSRDPTLQDAMSADEIKELQLAISRKDMNFRKKLKEIRASKSNAEAQKFIDQHRLEMDMMQSQLDLEKARMKAVLMAKLEARRKKGGTSDEADETEPPMSAEEIKQLQVILDQKSLDFKNRQKSAKKEMSAADLFKYMDAHQRDMESLEKRLALERLRMEQNIKDKMAARRFKRPGSATSTKSQDKPEDVETLEKEMMVKESTFLAEVESRKSQMSKEEYERLLAQHRKEMEELRRRMDRAKGRQMMHFQDKLDARRRRRQMWKNEEEERMRLMKLLNDKSEPLSKDEFNDIAEDILNYDEAVQSDIKEKEGKVSDKEYQKMLDDHKGNMDKLEQTLIEKGKGRNEEINGIEDQMKQQEAIFFSKVEQRKSAMPKDEYERLLKEHQEEMDDLKKRLGWAKGRQARHLQDKLEARRRRRKMLGNEEEERKRLLEQLAKVDRLSGEELEELEDAIDFYDISMSAVIEAKKGQVSDEEYNKMKAEHKRNMEQMNQSLDQKRLQSDIHNTEQVVSNVKGQVVNVAVVVDDGSDEDIDDGDMEDQKDLGIDASQLAVFTSTNLWTTPTQSNDVVIVPLKEEYPSKRKRELFTDPSIFRQIDAHAIKLAQTVSLVTQPSFSALVNELTEFGTTELQKVRLIFRWLTAQNCEEMDLNDVIDDTPLGVLKGLYHQKITFSTLFMRMCRYIGLQCVEICGIAKVKGYGAGQFISPKEPEFQHTWNSVRIDGFWHFVDCNWGVSHIAGSVTYDPFRFEYDEHYFLADPDVIILSHFPNDPAWQLLQSPLSLDEFNVQVLLKPDFFQFGFSLRSHKNVIIDVPNGDLNVQIHCPSGFILSCRLSTVNGDRDVAVSGVPFDLYEFIHQVGDELMACYVRIPEAGQFYLTMYARKQYLDGELNLESYTEICRYLVRCNSPSRDNVPLPYSPADHWGPIGTMSAGLVPVSHTSGVVVSTDGSNFTIRFKMTQPLAFTHTLTSFGVDDQRLVPYTMQRTVDEELVFTVMPPNIGRYALHVYVHYSGLPKPSHLCSYLLVAHQVRQNVQPMPQPEHGIWGATPAFSSLGLTAFTNADPLVITKEPATEITIGTNARIFLRHEMSFNGRDMTQAIRSEFGEGFVTFMLQLPYSGYYYFRLLGKDTDDPSIPNTLLFNYLVRRD